MATKAVKKASKPIKPVGDRVLVKNLGAQKVTDGGIIIPEAAQDKNWRKGEILAVGSGEFCDQVKVGNVIFFNDFAHFDLEVEGITLGVVDGEEIRAILNS